MASGIKDKVAILGMGCSKFGERWESGAEELMVEAFMEALQDAGIEKMTFRRAGFPPVMMKPVSESRLCHYPKPCACRLFR